MVTTAALVLLIAVLLVAAYARLWIAIATAAAAMFVFNFFFLDPVGTLTIADPQNLVAFVAFVTAALVASQLSATAKKRAQEALTSRSQLERLLDPENPHVLLETVQKAATAVGKRLEIMLEQVKLVRTALDDFYVMLSDEQKAQFEAIGPRRTSLADRADMTQRRGRR